MYDAELLEKGWVKTELVRTARLAGYAWKVLGRPRDVGTDADVALLAAAGQSRVARERPECEWRLQPG